MITELGLDRLGNRVDGALERNLVKLLDHLAVRELAEIATLRGRRTGRIGLRELRKLLRELRSRDLVELSLQILDLLERINLGRLGRRIVGNDVADDLLRLGRKVLLAGLCPLGLDHLVDENSVLELGARAFLAKGEFLEVLVNGLRGVRHLRRRLEEFLFPGLAVLIRHGEVHGLRLRNQDLFEDEALNDLIGNRLLRVLQLFGRDLVAAGLDELFNVSVNGTLHQLLAVDGNRHRVFLPLRLLVVILLAAAGNHRTCQHHRTNHLDIHMSLLPFLRNHPEDSPPCIGRTIQVELIEYTNYPCRVKGDLRIFCRSLRSRQPLSHFAGQPNTASLLVRKGSRFNRKRRPVRLPIIAGEVRFETRQLQHAKLKENK